MIKFMLSCLMASKPLDSRFSSLEKLFFMWVKFVGRLVGKYLQEVVLGKHSWLASMSNAIDPLL